MVATMTLLIPWRRFAVLAACLPSLLLAQISLQPSAERGVDGPALLYGTWGTREQCDAHRAGVQDDFRLFPYVIDDQWIQHGIIWCHVTWLGHQGKGEQLRAQAFLRCGEDSLREYHVFFDLQQGLLTMRWSEDFSTRPLQRC
jgi:hypothetical protein